MELVACPVLSDPFWKLIQVDRATVEQQIEDATNRKFRSSRGDNDPLMTSTMTSAVKSPSPVTGKTLVTPFTSSSPGKTASNKKLVDSDKDKSLSSALVKPIDTIDDDDDELLELKFASIMNNDDSSIISKNQANRLKQQTGSHLILPEKTAAAVDLDIAELLNDTDLESVQDVDLTITSNSSSKMAASIIGDKTAPVMSADDVDMKSLTSENASSTQVVFSWKKSLPTRSRTVSVHGVAQAPITMLWNEEKGVYRSVQQAVPCGQYKATLDVDGQRVPIDPVDIKFYTFEVDLFVIEEFEDKFIAADQEKSKREKVKVTEKEKLRTQVRPQQQKEEVKQQQQQHRQDKRDQQQQQAEKRPTSSTSSSRRKEAATEDHTSSSGSRSARDRTSTSTRDHRDSGSKDKVKDRERVNDTSSSSLQKSKRLAKSCVDLSPELASIDADMYRRDAYLSDLDNPADVSNASESSYGGNRGRRSLNAYEKLVRQQMDARGGLPLDDRAADRYQSHQQQRSRDDEFVSSSSRNSRISGGPGDFDSDRYQQQLERDRERQQKKQQQQQNGHHHGDADNGDLELDSWKADYERSRSPDRNGRDLRDRSPERASKTAGLQDSRQLVSMESPYSSPRRGESTGREAPVNGYQSLQPDSGPQDRRDSVDTYGSSRPAYESPAAGRFNSLPRDFRRNAAGGAGAGSPAEDSYRRYGSTKNLTSAVTGDAKEYGAASEAVARYRRDYPLSKVGKDRGSYPFESVSDAELDTAYSASRRPYDSSADPSDGRYSSRRPILATPPRTPSARDRFGNEVAASDSEASRGRQGGFSRGFAALGKQPLLPGSPTARGAPVANSQSSSRTITPISHLQADYKPQEYVPRGGEGDERLAALERCVADKDRELTKLREANDLLLRDVAKLKDNQLERLSKLSPNEQTKMYNQLLMEKENMATEVWKLQQELAKVKALQVPPSGDAKANHLDQYDPNHPNILQKKLHDMQSQLQDLQEAHETAVHNLARSEKELTELRQRNTVLQTTGRGFNRDLELENASLREQLERLKEVSYGGPSSRSRDDDWGGVNGEELRRLREENCQLLEDNVKLTRHLQESENWAGTDTAGRPYWRDAPHEKAAAAAATGRDAATYRSLSPSRAPLGGLTQSGNTNGDKLTLQNGSSGRYRHQSGDSDDLSDGGTRLSPASKGAALRSDKSSTVKFNLNDRPISAARAGGEAIGDVLDDVPPVKPSSSSSIFHRSSDITFDSFGDPRSLSPSRHVTSAVKDVADDAASALSDDLDGPTTGAGKRSSEAVKKDDDSAWPPLKAALRRERDSRRDSVASGETDLILDEAERELHSRAGGSSAESDDILGDSSRTRSPAAVPRSASPSRYSKLGSVEEDIGTAPSTSASASALRSGDEGGVAGKVPFVPRSAGDVRVGDTVKFSRQGGKISRGVIKYIGNLAGKNDTYLGVELEGEAGKHDGLFEGKRYFQCQANRGVFVAFNKVVLAWQRG